MGTILYYVSGHGFGHAVRSAEIIRVLLQKAPSARVLVRSDAPAWLFPAGVEYRELAVDVGLVQRDSLAHDLEATLQRVGCYLDGLADLAEQEAELARAAGVEVVVGDIPPLAFEVAARLGVPGLGVGNFSWDEIYAGLPDRPAALDPLIERTAAAYRRATVLLRLPLHLPMRAFPRVEDVPLVARRASRSRAETRAALGIAPERRVALLSFGGYDLDGLDVSSLDQLSAYTFIATPRVPAARTPPNVVQLPRDQPNYADLVAAADVVVTKLGYGIVADCLAQRVPLVYTDRPDFPEYWALADGVRRWARAVHVTPDELRRGALGAALEAALANHRPWAPIRLDGAEVVAARILAHVAGGRYRSDRRPAISRGRAEGAVPIGGRQAGIRPDG